MSGRIPQRSEAKSVPVRPKPVATSSQTSRTSCAAAGLGEAADVGRVGDAHAGGALDERLDHHGGERGGVLGDEGDGGVRPAGRRVAGRAQDGEAERVEDGSRRSRRRRRARARRTCPRGRRPRGRGSRLSGHALVGPELEGDPDRLLDRRGAVAREEEARIVDRHPLGERLGELDRRDVPIAEHGRVGDPVELVAEGLVELRHAVAERRDPERGDGVEVAPALGVDELVAVGALDDDRPAVRVGRHLREAVPDAGGVAVDPVGHAAEPSGRALVARAGGVPVATASPSLAPTHPRGSRRYLQRAAKPRTGLHQHCADRSTGSVAGALRGVAHGVQLAVDRELLERARLELAHALARDAEAAADLLERRRVLGRRSGRSAASAPPAPGREAGDRAPQHVLRRLTVSSSSGSRLVGRRTSRRTTASLSSPSGRSRLVIARAASRTSRELLERQLRLPRRSRRRSAAGRASARAPLGARDLLLAVERCAPGCGSCATCSPRRAAPPGGSTRSRTSRT